ncbi:MAG: hypothetical protein R2800_02460 [Flavipsychrobacter sp.]
MKNIFRVLLLGALVAVSVTSCTKKNENLVVNPTPQEQELITTIKLVVTNSAGFNKTFSYKVDNGFNSTTPATPVIDDVVLAPNTTYNVSVEVWNEAENPVEDITTEVKAENTEHLFVLESAPANGAGSISFTNGSKDDNGNPLNQTIDFTTGAAGNGVLTVTLKHEPTDKNAANADAAGGETDAKAIFPVKLN